jgi:hypothetical protein
MKGGNCTWCNKFVDPALGEWMGAASGLWEHEACARALQKAWEKLEEMEKYPNFNRYEWKVCFSCGVGILHHVGALCSERLK